MAQINKFKVKLSDFETETQISKNLGDKLSISEKEGQGLARELR